MISKTNEYALRAVVALAGDPARPHLAPQIADITGVPKAYLSKVLRTLVRGRLVVSQRGQGGGFTLARPASEISVLDVIDAVDPIERFHNCPLGLESHKDPLCPLHQRLDEAVATIQKTFAETTVSELTGTEVDAPSCHRPESRKS